MLHFVFVFPSRAPTRTHETIEFFLPADIMRAYIYEYAADAAAVGVNKCEWGGIVRDDVF